MFILNLEDFSLIFVGASVKILANTKYSDRAEVSQVCPLEAGKLPTIVLTTDEFGSNVEFLFALNIPSDAGMQNWRASWRYYRKVKNGKGFFTVTTDPIYQLDFIV